MVGMCFLPRCFLLAKNVAEDRTKGEGLFLPLSPCGTLWERVDRMSEANSRRVRGCFLSMERNPLIRHGLRIAEAKHRRLLKNGGRRPPTATFSHKGRREERKLGRHPWNQPSLDRLDLQRQNFR